jgi:hypothetical protein
MDGQQLAAESKKLIKDVIAAVKKSFARHGTDESHTIADSELPATNFIITSALENDTQVATMLDNILGGTDDPLRVHYMVALGASLFSQKKYGGDFYNYCLMTRQLTCQPYLINIVQEEGETKKLGLAGVQLISAVVQTKLTISRYDVPGKKKELKVTFFKMLPDGIIHALQDADFIQREKVIKKILVLYEISLKNKISVQGLNNKTGYFIFLMLVFQNYHKIFSSLDCATIKKEIYQTLYVMQQLYPKLTISAAQLCNAVEAAVVIYRYGIKHGFILADTQSASTQLTEAGSLLMSARPSSPNFFGSSEQDQLLEKNKEEESCCTSVCSIQ